MDKPAYAYQVVSASPIGCGLLPAGGEARSSAPRMSLYGVGFRLCRAQAGLKCCHRLLPAIVAKDKFVQVHLKLSGTHAMMGSDQPLLQVTDCTVGQGHHGFGSFTELDRGRATRYMLEPSFLQSTETFQAIGING